MSAAMLREVDKLEVKIIVDNYTDLFLLQGDRVMQRPPMAKKAEAAPVAEHGLSLLITAEARGEKKTILADTGLSETVLLHNLKIMDVDPDAVDKIFLSHGHVDHFGGLKGFLRTASGSPEIIAHPAAFSPRRINIPNDHPVVMPVLEKDALLQAGSEIRETPEAAVFCSGMALALGEVERVTDFEAGFGWAEIKGEDGWVKDPFLDDQGLVFNVKGKGLVVIGGCSHAGIVNTVKHAQKTAGIPRILAVMGGFHLTGPMFEPITQPTIEALREINPDYVMPMHCTGWKAINRFAQEMPDQFFLTSVGTSYVFTEAD